ncbi:hypothetical protein FHW12_004030 [Dokdonella fugitiva]|uniref:Uncharacterized protein n=1 Tax=Dokdonella fugitiva TaxID=328517 RepID=A0A839F403_9GAMM|nr:hypothetical protein [Dokdonella fugitiva]MBA8889783.1 hypothetical protein [Dokdonella fugitiva]
MNDRSLSSLYRRLSAERPALPEAELGRLLRELEPESEALATAVAALRRPAHPARLREHRFAAARRPAALRWVGSLAACCALVVGAFALHGHQAARWNVASSSSSTPAAADRIFSTNDRIFASNLPHETVRSDELFRTDFSSGG